MGKHVVSDAEDEVEYEGEEDREPVEGDAVEGRDDDEEDEDDEEGQDEYEKDGFIGDDVDEEEEEEEEERADSDEERQKKKKKRKKKLHEGDILTCKIKSIQKNRYQVFLICRESEMRNNRHQHVQNLDTYYHEDRSNHQSEQEKAQKEKELAKKHFKPRMIVHPRFQNITADEAMQCLSDKDPGESIIRHSSRGPSYLTLTLKVYDGVYAHKDIVEGGKEHKDITSLLRIGKTLKIGEDTLGDGPIC